MYLIDTNIFLEVLLGQSNAQSCGIVFKKLEDGSIDCVCSHFSIYSILLRLEREKLKVLAGEFLEYVLSFENLHIVNLSLEDDLAIIENMQNSGLDFDDALQCHTAKETGCEAIITLDKDFAKAGIPALSPREVQ